MFTQKDVVIIVVVILIICISYLMLNKQKENLTENQEIDKLVDSIVQNQQQPQADSKNTNNAPYQQIIDQVVDNSNVDNYNNDSSNNDIITYNVYYADWCGYSRKFKEYYESTIKPYLNSNISNIRFEFIDCEENKDRCKNIEGFPTIIASYKGQDYIYTNKRILEDFINFAQSL